MASKTGRRAADRSRSARSDLLAPLISGLGRLVRRGVQRRPFRRDPAFIEQLYPLMKLSNLYHGVEFHGWQHVPRDAPCLIVGNHSGGAETNDFGFLLCGWIERRGAQAPLYGLAYDLLFGTPIIGPALSRLGILPASHANARKALARNAAVVTFPGGDYEVFRPWRERNRIDFGGHTGFVHLAITAGVPVVPMTIHGAHQSTFVLTRGRRLARSTGMDRLHVNVFPFIWSIPFGPTPAFMPSVQLPSKISIHFGTPFDWTRYTTRQADDPAVLRRCYDEITSRMQATLDRLARARPYPVLDRLRELKLADALRELEALYAQRPARRRPPRRRKTR
ncbi:MAG TPA: lysophospholipid acyltransferase family protein [Candidatus Dormibacteraeota bacterium]|nr:lysophospholipid acyltransferase family protein [Candidatus Dormibacteraeota bacterium]